MSNQRVNKSKYWTAVLYPESMISNWQNKISETVQVPYCYCVHNKSLDTKSEHRKDHVHMILCWNGPTTYNHALEVFNLLGKVNTCKAVIQIRFLYDYLIHDTKEARKQGKELYSKEERICGNNFDIGLYEQKSLEDKKRMRQEITDFIRDNELSNFLDVYNEVQRNFDNDYLDVLLDNGRTIDLVIKGVYHHKLSEQSRLDLLP